MKCLKRSLLSLVLVLLSPLAYSQSFDPEAVYEVTGAELNELEKSLTTAKSELTQSKSELTVLSERLTTASESLKESEAEAIRNSIIIGVVTGLVGLVAGLLL